MCSVLLRRSFACPRLCARPLQLRGCHASSSGHAAPLAVPVNDWDVVDALLRKELDPLRQRASQIATDIKPIEQELRNVDQRIFDWEKRVEAAKEHVTARQEEARKWEIKIEEIHRALHDKKDERAALRDEYVRKALEVGMAESAASYNLELACKNPNAAEQLRSPLLQEFAKVHAEILDMEKHTNEAHACAAKARDYIPEKLVEADELRSKALECKTQKDELAGRVEGLRAEEETVSAAISRMEMDGARMRKAAAWAQRVSPLLKPTEDNLRHWLLHRHQAIFSVAVSADDSCLHLLRELEPSADELASFPHIPERLKRAGFPAAEMKAMGFSLLQLKRAGYSGDEMRGVGFTRYELMQAGFGVEHLKQAGMTITELKRAGFTLLQMKRGGFTAEELKDEGYNAVELSAAGCSLAELMSSGFTAQELVDARFDPQLIKAAYRRCMKSFSRRTPCHG